MVANVQAAPACGTTCRKQRVKNYISKIGWGSILAALLLASVFAMSFDAGVNTAKETAHNLLFLSPFLIASFVIAGYAKAASLDMIVTRAFRGKVALMIILAGLAGALTPLCSCSVVALIAVLLRAGIPLSAVMAFWMASPVISPDLYVYTWGILGTELANVRLVSALFMAFTAGFATLAFERWFGAFKSPLRGDMEVAEKVAFGEVIDPVWRFWKESERRVIFWEEFKKTARAILPWMVLAFVMESIIGSHISVDLVKPYLGTESKWAIPMAVLIGIPTYINGVAAVPVVQGLLSLGMTKPAAMAYITAGSITTVPAIMAVLPLVKFRVFLWHLIAGVATSLIAAYAYQAFLAI